MRAAAIEKREAPMHESQHIGEERWLVAPDFVIEEVPLCHENSLHQIETFVRLQFVSVPPVAQKTEQGDNPGYEDKLLEKAVSE